MRIHLFFFSLMVCLMTVMTAAETASQKKVEEMLDDIHWLGQAAVRIESGEKTVYIDPYKIDGGAKADLILITHPHQDHLSVADIRQVIRPQTVLVTCPACLEILKREFENDIVILPAGESRSIGGLRIEAVPAYNVQKTFHKKESGWVGFVIRVEGVRIYHTGDTERIPEMKGIACDIILLPLGRTYTMSGPEEAAGAALDSGARIAIPIHYGMYEGTAEDARRFQELLEGKIQVVIKKAESIP